MAQRQALGGQRRTGAPALRAARSSRVTTMALFKSKTVTAEPRSAAKTTSQKAAGTEQQRKGPTFGSIMSALDASVPTKKDADILWDAKSNWKKGQSKLSPEEYAALARKVRGSYRDFFKDTVVEERVESTYYKPSASGGTVPFLPVLLGIVVAMLGTTAYVVSQTGSP